MLVKQLRDSIRTHGLLQTIGKIIRKPVHLLRTRRILRLGGATQRFEQIYLSNYWGNNESASGAGSTLEYTENLRKHLPVLFEQFSISSVLDAPCGDFNWMSQVMDGCEVEYVGGDIVRPLIESLGSRATDRIRFVTLDISTDKFPNADLWISRDCWFHLSYSDLAKALQGFLAADISYVLATSEIPENCVVNSDIVSGDYRRMDLFAAPYGFPRNTLYEVDDWLDPDPPRKMYLWDRQQVKVALQNLEDYLADQ